VWRYGIADIGNTFVYTTITYRISTTRVYDAMRIRKYNIT
jgi:hypothetical protein